MLTETLLAYVLAVEYSVYISTGRARLLFLYIRAFLVPLGDGGRRGVEREVLGADGGGAPVRERAQGAACVAATGKGRMLLGTTAARVVV